MKRKTPLSFYVVGLAALAAACSNWDAAVGVRCDEYPTFCRAPSTSLSPTNVDGGAGDGGCVPAGDAGAPVSFRQDIRPLMNRVETDPTGPGCSFCHYRTTGERQGINEGGLDMT